MRTLGLLFQFYLVEFDNVIKQLSCRIGAFASITRLVRIARQDFACVIWWSLPWTFGCILVNQVD